MNLAITAIFAISLTACFPYEQPCPGDVDPATVASREADIVRTLVHKEDSDQSISKTLTARGYTCSDQKGSDGNSRDLICQKSMCWSSRYRCSEEVLVQRIQNKQVDNFGIHGFEAGVNCRNAK